jgi:hypothetical protein
MNQIKSYTIPLVSLLLFLSQGCVQKAYKKTVVVTLAVQNIRNITTVGIRGNGSPLSWEKDFEMKPLIKDSVYTASVTALTGYKFAEIKFVVNSEFELKDKPNRRVVFSEGDTTYYKAVFDVNK